MSIINMLHAQLTYGRQFTFILILEVPKWPILLYGPCWSSVKQFWVVMDMIENEMGKIK